VRKVPGPETEAEQACRPHHASDYRWLTTLSGAWETEVVTLTAGQGIFVPADHAHAAHNVAGFNLSVNVTFAKREQLGPILWDTYERGIERGVFRTGLCLKLGTATLPMLQAHTDSLVEGVITRLGAEATAGRPPTTSLHAFISKKQEQGSYEWATEQMGALTKWSCQLAAMGGGVGSWAAGVTARKIETMNGSLKRVMFGTVS
jgi:hypothetical protein